MRILGIDPGYAIVGWGVLDYSGNKFSIVDFGAVTTEAGTPFSERLKVIYEDISYIMDRTHPEALAMEKLFFQNNQKTAIDVAQARGVLMLAAEQHCIDIFEYTPLQVKQGVVGYGKAEKKQVMEMTRTILGLEKVPKPDDTADALAMAICHAHTNGMGMERQRVPSVKKPTSSISSGFNSSNFSSMAGQAASKVTGSKDAGEFTEEVVDGIMKGIKVGQKILKERKGI